MKLDDIGYRIQDLTYDFLTPELITTPTSKGTKLHKRLDQKLNFLITSSDTANMMLKCMGNMP